MTLFKVSIKQLLILSLFFLLILFSNSLKLFADEILWLEVSKTDHELVVIDPKSIKYNNEIFFNYTTRDNRYNYP